jgi:hypothetical protein
VKKGLISCSSHSLWTVLINLFLILSIPSIAFTQEIIHATKTNLFQWAFKEPIEKLVVFCNDGELLIFTNEFSEGVVLKPWTLKEYLKKNNKQIKDILFISHNHLLPNNFSEGDYRFYCWLKNRGFKGKFIIYYNYDGKIKEMEK